MAAPHKRDGGSLKTAPAKTGGPFCTYADRGGAPAYGDLAEKARAAGYKISASQVRRWVMDELLPSTGRRVSMGRKGFRTERNEGVAEQLLALCEFRTMTKSWDRLAILLWAGGWPVPVERYRRAVLAELPQTPDPQTLTDRKPKATDRDPETFTDDELDKLDQTAAELAPRYRRLLRRSDRHQTADVTSAVLAMGLGVASTTSAEVAGALDRATAAGPHDAASYDPAAEVERFRGIVSIPRVRRLIEQASAAELETARSRVRALLHAGLAPMPGAAVVLAMLAESLGIDGALDGFVAVEEAAKSEP